MKTKIVFLFWLLTTTCLAQQLRFRSNGEFKIAQFTDLHYAKDNPRSMAALKCLDAVIGAERPDLIVVTGDIIYSWPGDKAMQDVLDCVDKHNIPFVFLFGNHDAAEGATTNEALYDQMRKMKNNIQPDRKGATAPDYVLTIRSHTGKNNAALLYCLDSHSMSTLKGEDGYAWLTFEQVAWYRAQSQQLAAANQGKPLPALAFFHIPLPEYNTATTHEEAVMIGTRMEAACSPKLNSGMFTAMKEGGDVMGIFVGHDHDNDYSVMWHNILLAYGRFSGGNTEYNHLPNGARIIVLKEGERSFDTYIRLRSGEVVNRSKYPDSYIKDDWRTRKISEE